MNAPGLSSIKCSCGYRVEGEEKFVLDQYAEHRRLFHPEQRPAGEPQEQVVLKAIVGLSAPGTPLRASLNVKANELLQAGHNPQDVAALIEQGDNPEDV